VALYYYNLRHNEIVSEPIVSKIITNKHQKSFQYLVTFILIMYAAHLSNNVFLHF